MWPTRSRKACRLASSRGCSFPVAVLHRRGHRLDEPTSGVDPDRARRFLAHADRPLRNDGVTVFLSTFMNEAERCDRISLMHAQGRVLAVGTPKELVKKRGSASAGGRLRQLSGGSKRNRQDKEGAGAATGAIGGQIADQGRPIACFQAIRSRTTVGLCPARSHGALTRSHPARGSRSSVLSS